jgi:hypothetical protein
MEAVMARIGGRSTWLAVPAGMLCAGVVAALVWLALPMVPASVEWVGDTLRTATAPRAAPVAEKTPAQLAVGGTIDCRTLYPDGLWSELTWTGGVLLSQSTAPPATSVTSLTDALTPNTRVTCSWRLPQGGGIVTTLALVGADAVPLAEAALRGQGFTCSTADGALRCVRSRGDVTEDQRFRDGLWLSSVETMWRPKDYGSRVAAQVWNSATG